MMDHIHRITKSSSDFFKKSEERNVYNTKLFEVEELFDLVDRAEKIADRMIVVDSVDYQCNVF